MLVYISCKTLYLDMKVALCFLISYKHILNKESLWREWIEPNKDIIHVYFHYDNFHRIKSPWIQSHTIPPRFKVPTSYFNMVPAYMSILSFAHKHSSENQWFIMLTESCVPIISPQRFRQHFLENADKSILHWSPANWNVGYHKRANLRLLPQSFHLLNDPWFVLKREDVQRCFQFIKEKPKMYNSICRGGLANESIFAIILRYYGVLKDAKNSKSTCTDWSRMSSKTSPHLFQKGYENKHDFQFIKTFIRENQDTMFLRKVDPHFPDEFLHWFVFLQK